MKKSHSKLLKTIFCFITALVFNVIVTRTTVSVTNTFENAEYKKTIVEGLISQVPFNIEARCQMFYIALGPVAMCIPFGTIGLLYLLYNTE